jgi:hypothetical protein
MEQEGRVTAVFRSVLSTAPVKGTPEEKRGGEGKKTREIE